MADNIRLPAGFVLDQQADGSATIKLPPGFQLDQSPTFAEGAADFAGQIPVGFNKGLNAVMSAPGAVMAWGAEKLGASKETADKFRFNNPLSEFLTSGQGPTTTPGRYGEAVGHALGASAVPSAGIMAMAPRVAAAGQAAASMTPTRAAVQQVAEGITAAPGSAAAYDVASNVTSGLSSQAAQEAGFGQAGQMIAGMAGVAIPGVVAAGTAGTRNMIGRARANQGEAGAYGSIVDDLGRPVDQFADEIAAGGSRANIATNRRTLDILGEEMVRANGNRQAALNETVSRIATENGITTQAAQQHIRRLTQVHEESPLMFGEYPAVAQSDIAQRMRRPGNVDLDEIGRVQPNAVQGTMDYLANNGNAQSAQNVRQAVSRRQEELAPTMQGTLADMGPQVQTGARSQRPMLIEDIADNIDQARQVAGAEYRNAYQGPINDRYATHFLPMIVRANLGRAANRAGEPRAAIERAVNQINLNVANRSPAQTLQMLQDARATMRGQIREYRQAGRNDLAGAVQPVYDQMTTLMTRMSPDWAVANRRWADLEFDTLATELGDAFALKASPQFRRQIAEFRQLAPEAQDIVRVHFLQKLYDKFDNLGDSHGVSKMFANDHSRTMINELFGPQAAVTFSRALRDQKVAEATGAMMGNSRTHARGVAQKQKDAETGIVTAIQQGSAQNVRNWLMERAAQIMTEHRNRPLADVVTTPLNDTARVAQHLQRMRQQERTLQQFNEPRRVPDRGYGARSAVPFSGQDDKKKKPDKRASAIADRLASLDEGDAHDLMRRVKLRLQQGGIA